MLDFSKLLGQRDVILAVVGGAAVATVAVLIMSRRKRRLDEYELVGEVASIHCYPVKSMRAISHEVGFCTVSGIRMLNARDRQFVVVRPDGAFITQRQISKMAGIKVSIEGNDLKLQADGMPDIAVPLNPKKNDDAIATVRVWTDNLFAQDCGTEIDQWLTKFLETEEVLRMVLMMPGLTNRDCKVKNSTKKDKLAFQDESPYLITTEESLEDLKQRLDSPAREEITMRNFRPNIVIKNTKGPWDEDNWSHVVFGKKLRMRALEPMARCRLTTVDPNTCEKREDGEPLKTLKRMFPEINKASPMFGVSLGVDVENAVRVGDPVYAKRKTS